MTPFFEINQPIASAHMSQVPQSSLAQGPCRKIQTSLGMMEYLESTKGSQKLDPQWKVIRSMEYEGSNMLFYVDTEFADSHLAAIHCFLLLHIKSPSILSFSQKFL